VPGFRSFALLALLALAGCATNGSISTAQPALPAPQARENAERYIVLAVANDPDPIAAHVGSTARSYGGQAPYAVSDGARRALRDVAADYRLQQVSAWPIGALHLQCALLQMPEGAQRDALMRQLQGDHRVALVEPLQEYAVRTTAPDPYSTVQPGHERMDIASAHRWSRGRGVRIALIDTGLDSAHPDLRGRIDLERNFVDEDSRRFQLDRHGTAIAGVIAANADNGVGIVGIAPEARLIALKACWQLQDGRDDARCNSYTLAQALAAAIELKARIINLSLTGPPDALLAALVNQATRAGIIIVGPMGEGPSFPGSIEHVLNVGRSEDRVALGTVLQAPGREVLTLAPGGRYDFFSGSSISTGEISGITALMLALRSNLDASQAQSLLSRATSTTESPAGPVRSVNACLALAALTGGQDCGKPPAVN
jgi:subtilase family protein